MKNILLPTDFSENSWNAIRYALSFFDDVATNFHLLHVSLMEEINEEEFFYKISDEVMSQKVMYSPIEELQATLKKTKKLSTNKNHHFSTIHEYTQFIDTIKKNVKEKEIDYIVMGTKGASQKNNTTIGSHTGDVITRVKCPILIIPEKAVYSEPKNIVFPTDFNIFFKNRVLQTLSDTLKIKKSKLSILYISKKVKDLTALQKKNRSFLQDHLEDKTHDCYYVTNQDIESALESFVATSQVDIIAMVAKNLNFFQRILFTPNVKKISYHTKIPFLVLHE